MPAAPPRAAPPRRWDLFCRVVDNFGDAGVCWRLAAALAGRGQAVRLVIDDPSPLAWMAPQGAAGVEVLRWPAEADAAAALGSPGDVVVEAFGCDPPAAHVAAMRAAPRAPLWINLEHLSAEAWVERAHGLPSPQPGGLVKWFLFPGFTARTLGLIHEPVLDAHGPGFDGRAWRAAQGWGAVDETAVLLFGYASAPWPALLQRLAADGAPLRLLLPPGALRDAIMAAAAPPGLRTTALPFVSQPDFDRLLASVDLAFVRGEDSPVRALWAGTPFVWQAYPQHDGAHHAKVEALLQVLGLDAGADAAADAAAWWRGWNAVPGARLPAAAPAPATWKPWFDAARQRLRRHDDLVTGLLRFADAHG